MTTEAARVVGLRNALLLPLASIDPNPANVRGDSGDLDELAASIAEHGVLHPLIVTLYPASPDRYVLVDGHRRWEAAHLAGLTEVPALLRTDLDTVAAVTEVMLFDQLHRAALNPVEEAHGIARLLRLGYGRRDVARRLGKSQSYVADRLRLLELTPDTQDRVVRGDLGVTAATDAVVHALPRASRRPPGPVRFDRSHQLAAAARDRCGHDDRLPVGGVACGACWEAAIRADERAKGAGGGAVMAGCAGRLDAGLLWPPEPNYTWDDDERAAA